MWSPQHLTVLFQTLHRLTGPQEVTEGSRHSWKGSLVIARHRYFLDLHISGALPHTNGPNSCMIQGLRDMDIRKGVQTMPGHDDLIRAFASIRSSTLGYLRTIVRDPHLAEDLFQETWVVVSGKIDSFDQAGDFGAWVRTIALNLARNALRKGKHLHPMPAPGVLESIEEAHASRSMRDLQESSERLVYLDQCLKKVDRRQRSILEHRYGEGASLRVIATRLGRSPGAIQVALFRMRQFLLRCIEEEQKRATLSHG